MRMITVDPGLHCGIAWWLDGIPLDAITLTHTRTTTEYFAKADSTIKKVRNFMYNLSGEFVPDIVYLEWPAVFPSPGGQTAARTGNIVKLAYITGRIAEVFKGSTPDLQYVDVQKWKGQVPKKVMNQRVQQILEKEGLGPLGHSTHELDALGIGLWVLGKLGSRVIQEKKK